MAPEQDIPLQADVAAFLASTADAPGLDSLHVADARALIDSVLPTLDAPRVPVLTTRASARIGERLLDLAVYTPSVPRDLPIVGIYLHGGGWAVGSLMSHDALVSTICDTLGITVLSVGYRLAPEWPFPAAVDDLADVIDWHADTLSRDPALRYVLMGDSAGAHICAAQHVGRSEPDPRILAQWLIYPVLDLDFRSYESASAFGDGFGFTSAEMDWYASMVAPERDQKGVSGDARLDLIAAISQSSPPPTIVTACSHDLLRDQGRAYAEALTSAGVPVIANELRGQIHGAFCMRQSCPSAALALASTLETVAWFLGDLTPVTQDGPS